MPDVKFSDAVEVVVIVPTMGHAPTLLPSLDRLVRTLDGHRARVLLVVNPDNSAHAAETVAVVRKMRTPEGVTVEPVLLPGPVGFARAVNEGVHRVVASGVPAFVVVANDDAWTSDGWLTSMSLALDSTEVQSWGEPPGPNGIRPSRAANGASKVADYGRIGLVGPVSDLVAGTQWVGPHGVEKFHATGGETNLDGFSFAWRNGNAGPPITADFLSGFFLLLRREAFAELLERAADGRPTLFDERFGIGGYEDNDLMVRAESAGWRCVVDASTFVHHQGHQSLDRVFPAQQRGMANRFTFYEKWSEETARRKRIVATYRVGLEVPHDLACWRDSIIRAAAVGLDGFAVLLTDNPCRVVAPTNVHAAEAGAVLGPDEIEYLRRCNGKSREEIATETERWIRRIVAEAIEGARPDVSCSVWSDKMPEWTQTFDERAERNAAIRLAEEMSADWILSIDHDEVIEDRIERRHLDRLTQHPDPLVRSWEFGWLNHWDSPRLVRQDPPWGDGGAYADGMRGFRLWKVCKAAPRRILAGNEIGLHCGNCPDHDPLAKRVAALRFRHLGYLRAKDRERKHRRYVSIDRNPSAALTGGGYNHLVAEEGMRLSAFVAVDGVALSMLVHAGEDLGEVARWLDSCHGLLDEVRLVWTDDDDDAFEKARYLLRPFGVDWTRHILADNLGATRNAGLDALWEAGEPNDRGIGWLLSLDPDEFASDPFRFGHALRRAAECSDSWAWIFRFANLRPSSTREEPTTSETVRLFRVEPNRFLRWSGRVHETLDRAEMDLVARGIHPQARYFACEVVNRGLALDGPALRAKLERYQRLLRLELADDPTNPGAWVSLGLQYANDGDLGRARECYERAVLVAGESYLPFQQLGLLMLREAQGVFAAAVERLAPGVPQHRVNSAILDSLRTMAPPQPILAPAEPSTEPLPELTVEDVERARARSVRSVVR
jgi:GT2 family glycosyltransferase